MYACIMYAYAYAHTFVLCNLPYILYNDILIFPIFCRRKMPKKKKKKANNLNSTTYLFLSHFMIFFFVLRICMYFFYLYDPIIKCLHMHTLFIPL
ncbi:hypothetical protein [Plasmodium yoelii yoelii]|uniref:Uncharacterized protein n=1 Tax=Plasmodium yoelii yoelii TaxID=73239 RepID=Q7RR42_PLAYO|nr:hypothetical protein [Plasmodium yoelii yoelii]